MIYLDRTFGLRNKTALITGATGGIGTSIAHAFAQAGANLVVASNDDALGPLANELGSAGTNVLAVPTDVRSDAELDRLVGHAFDRFGSIDVLICNAGVNPHFGRLNEAPEEARSDAFNTNLKHALHLTNIVAPSMAQGGGGSIVLTSSIAGLRGNAKIGLYGITKAALIQLARNLAVEWGPHGVRANAIAPGLIRTSWADAILSSPEATKARMQMTPLRRAGEPEEVAATALFLASPGGAFITGQTIVVDGGTLISDGS